MHWKLWTFVGLLAPVIATSAYGQPPSEEEDLALAYGDRNFVSIATGTKQLVRKAPSTASVISAEDIAAMGATTVSQVLEAVPGMHVARNTLQNNYTPTYGMRGILTGTSPHVLMMVNGVPRTSVYLGNPDELPVELPVENIARIEVIRGPGSAVYGADAFAGTINIITKTADDIDGTSIGLRAGTYNSWDTWFQHGSRRGDLEIAGYLKVGTTDGQRRTIRADLQTGLDAIFGTAASRAPGPVNIGHDSIDGQVDLGYNKFRLRAGYTLRENMGSGAGIAGALDPYGKIRSERMTSDLSWNDEQFTRDLSLTLQISYMQLANEVTTPLRVFPAGANFGAGAFAAGVLGSPDKWERQTRLSASSVYSGFADHRFRIGLGHDELEINKTSEAKNFVLVVPGPGLPPVPVILPGGFAPASPSNLFLAPHQRRVDYVYLQDEWSFARDWTLTAGARYDNYSDFGSTTNPRVALVWEARHDLTAKLMYGKAFRAPSFIEQYAAANPVAVGNPGLSPEKITTFEGSLTWQAKPNLQTSLSLFRHEISDLISQIRPSYINAGKQTGSGGEWEIRWNPNAQLALSGHYAYQKNVDETTRHDAGFAPHHHVYAIADWRFVPNWQISAQLNYVADRNRAWGDNRPQIPDYTTVDLTVRSERTKSGWDFSASVYNLFGADVREPSAVGSGITYDLPMPGRTFWLQGRYAL